MTPEEKKALLESTDHRKPTKEMLDEPRGRDNIKRLVRNHLIRYCDRLVAGMNGHPNVRMKETRILLWIWSCIAEKGCNYSDLSEKERTELDDAILAGE
jgi:hypothetical protein